MSSSNTRKIPWRVSIVAAAVAALLVAATMVSANAQAAAGCRVAYTVSAQWSGGFTANVNVTNLGDPINGWRLVWTFPAGQRVTQAWNATVTTSGGQTIATNMSYNANIATNGSVSFGYNGAWSGSNTAPTSFTLNGVACTGNVGPTASPTPTATPTPTPTPTTSPSPTPQPQDPMAQVAAMQPGWNLGNTFDAIPDETSWGNPLTTREMLHYLRSQGYNSIRIPITWSNHHGAAPDYTIDPVWLNRVQQVIDWSLAEGFYVMINLHHDSWQWINTYPGDRTTVMNRYRALWTQLATTFRSHSSKLVFESINEPQFAGTSGDAESDQRLHELNLEFVRLVRGTGGGNATRLLVLPTLHTNGEQGRLDALLATINELDDPNLAATIHFYGWWPFSVNIAGGTRYDTNVEQDILGTFDRAHNTFVQRDIPVIIGEWALLSYDYTRPGIINRGELLKFFESVGYNARIRNLTTMLWDAGSFLHRPELRWRDQGIYEMMKASLTTRSATASTDQIYVPRTGSITAKSLTLNLNGLSFRGLWQGNTQLANGTDYTVSGNTLTLTAAAVTRLVGNRAYGVNATIEARFSAGVPWQLSILSYDRPTQAAATGPTSSFAIPTQFRGDQLATMEAKYPDGSGAGPANWTSYKEFWTHFQPDYAANTIILKPEFFAEVNDGTVNLTFHFWSGTQITYRITKSGTTVTGSTT
ncbi:cellulase family glycosylhydrolase [Solwaraspora sp. WMMD1047]|uniref:cellulase family glycosylhydrolase n=1 Tax=Solwaraspora sp. WMMD1047 TaxID=3016102 RepID=UPI0024163DA0|nr:cellulase family glycosylhydrolase [Solwaraspora sp. WMMD1047]MDG4832010.1 cellulase family glycosylhydrolase [Solwaraspora sp. WMMD1047]